MIETSNIVFERRKKENVVGEEVFPLPSPIDVHEKTAIKASLGEIQYVNMWIPSTSTLITNTGAQLVLELTSPGSLKWKPVGDVSYILSDVKLFWDLDNNGSCHMVDGKKYAMEMVFTFTYNYEVSVSSELIHKRVELHRKYKELVATKDDDERAELTEAIGELENEYDELENSILQKRYIHSEAKEALSKRKPTKFVIEKPRGLTYSGKDLNEDDDDDDDNEEEDKDGHRTSEHINFDRDIKFRVERTIHELAAKRFNPYYEELQKRKSNFSDADVEEFLMGQSLKTDSKTAGSLGGPSFTMSIGRDDPPIDQKMFPTERDKARERARRAKYLENKMKRDKLEMDEKLEWIKKHQAQLQVKIAVLFEVQKDAPYYSLFSFLPRVTEPCTRILVDGNLLLPFKDALTNNDYFAYTGSRFLYQDQEVVWIIKKDPMPILDDQVWALRNLKNEFGKRMESSTGGRMKKLEGRPIYFNVPQPKDEPPTCPGKDKCLCDAYRCV